MASSCRRRSRISTSPASSLPRTPPRMRAQQRASTCSTASPTKPTWRKLGPVDVIVLLDVIEHLPDPPRDARAVRAASHSRRHHRDHHRRFRLALCAARRHRLAADDAAAASVVLHAREPEAARRHARHAARGRDHPWKIVPVSLILFQLRRMLGLRRAAKPPRAMSACRSTCSTPCASCCRSRRHERPPLR